jgi:hypothetical protein
MGYEKTLEMMRVVSAKLKQDLKKMNTAIEVVECFQIEEERKEKKALVTRVCQLLRGV